VRILIQQPRLTHYRVPLYNRLVQQHGWRLTVAFTPRSGAGESGLEVRQADLFECVGLPLRQYRMGGLKLNFQQGLLRLLRSREWDAFFWEGANANWSGYLAARWCRQRGIPNICWLKGYFTPQNPLRRFVNRLQLRTAHAFVPYGDSTHEFLKAYGVRPEQIVRAYNTVDVETIAANRERLLQQGRTMLEAIGWEQARPLIACVGRIIPEKRVQDAVKVVALLQRQGYTAYLLVVGDGPERTTLERLACELGIQSQVHFTGRVPEDGDSAALAAADVAVFPGAHGLAINQAMALGTPVVVADLPGPDGEMVRHGETGWRYEFGNLQAFADAIQSALSSAERAQVVANAQEEILQRRNLARYAEAFGEAVRVAQRFAQG